MHFVGEKKRNERSQTWINAVVLDWLRSVEVLVERV